jgi:ankyrin repeat protein
LNIISRYQSSALHVAAKNNNIEIVNLLLEHKADIMKKNYEAKTCLDDAIDRGNGEIV